MGNPTRQLERWQDVATFYKPTVQQYQIAQQMTNFYRQQQKYYLSARAKIQATKQNEL